MNLKLFITNPILILLYFFIIQLFYNVFVETLKENIDKNNKTININDSIYIQKNVKPLKNCNFSFSANYIDYLISSYIYPLLILFGLLGNCLNLLVLLSKGMRNQANLLLSAMAFSDLSVIVLHIPEWLSTYAPIRSNLIFRVFYFKTYVYRLWFKNAFSMASCWFVLGVSMERFIGIRSPMHTRQTFRAKKTIVGIIIMVIICLLLCYHWILLYEYESHNGPPECNNSYTYYQIVETKNNSKILSTFIKFAKHASIFYQVIIPVVTVNILNILLILIVKKRPILSRTSSSSNTTELRRISDFGTFLRQEKKVTTTVISILICFTLTQTPSIIPTIISFFGIRSKKLSVMTSILNLLVIFGKVLNFVLFCTASVHFRRRTITMLEGLLCRNYSKKFSNINNSYNYRIVETQSRNVNIAGRNISTSTSVTRAGIGHKTSLSNNKNKANFYF
ncbi:G protein-coupled receptor, rhodopsin-like family and GPCR, rhodopsin-like, 7TM domain and 7TM GPCR, serpentine receptor class w (Srw) family-containing protein [Strongyloides ratti]|uniref:G protein-coupled receptor, rhodopsin-like family and GPCR, rhodopsin-like, 7TM domain and 7TM GPCR, serpentine receptor class w (Srw) family-containing protein n=1 Tax=Strongyloides ratti TaxID=34506 RepID=A0A090LT67_STRRB|nr:G protein-coupled receptor, rhodopsin-like family and GPCR, rhodopsin-like, 7TM domain and 7TM GPCR, serpentine receptor class w (Srw) family-containing protein [Strongyloides ratti]CEF71412.1 G protein-coupled receptor, rhodopsin-like family and GPCR, rhodopsin-like, 7TM domain and 7TM GPCR, serpentine receptor class w (Srw) family-containing protein [Strongyloides ratti]